MATEKKKRPRKETIRLFDRNSSVGMTRRAPPPMKRTGNKYHLAAKIGGCLSVDLSRRHIVEGFAGGGGLTAYWQPRSATWVELDRRVVAMHEALKNSLHEVAHDLDELRQQHLARRSRDSQRRLFEAVRAAVNANTLTGSRRVAAELYLAELGFNGLGASRRNRKGELNVNLGDVSNPFADMWPRMVHMHGLLQRVEVLQGSIFDADLRARLPRDPARVLWYFDPPYEGSKLQYGEPFALAEHMRLANLVRELDREGVPYAVSNSDTADVRALYDGLQARRLEVRRPINSKVSERKKPVFEFVISNVLNQCDDVITLEAPLGYTAKAS